MWIILMDRTAAKLSGQYSFGSGDDAKFAKALWGRAAILIAKGDRAQAWHLALRARQLLMAADDGAPRGDKASERGGQLQQRRMDWRGADMSDRIDAHQAGLKLGNLGKRVVDRVFNGTDLGSDFEGGILKHLF